MPNAVAGSIGEEKSCTKGHLLPPSNKEALTRKNVLGTLLKNMPISESKRNVRVIVFNII